MDAYEEMEAALRGDEAELTRCPFCGTEAILENWEFGDFFTVVCADKKECGAQGPDRATEQDAITAWNTRTLTEGEH